MGRTPTSTGAHAGRGVEPEHEDFGFRNLWRFLAFSLPYWPSLLGGVLTGLQRMVLMLWMPLLVRKVIDEIANPFVDGRLDAAAAWRRLLVLMGVTGGLMALHWLATLGRFYFPHRAAASAIRDIRFQLFRHLQRLSLGFHTQRATGGIVARVIADVQAAQYAFDIVLVQLSQQILRGIVISVILFSTDWQWALVAFATTPLFLISTNLIRRPMRRASRRTRETVEIMSGRVEERMAMIREVQAFTAEAYEEQRVLDDAERLRRHTLRQRLLAGVMQAAAEITRLLGMAIVLGFGVYRIVHGGSAATLGALPMFYMYTSQVLQPMQFFANLYTQIQVAAAAADRVMEFFDTEPAITDRPNAAPLKLSGPPEIVYEHVSFSYPTDDPAVVLEDIDLRVAPGMRVVLVGESGGGKSTLMSLLPRFYDIQGGRILVDGQDVRGVTIRSLRNAIAVVPQEPVLFSGSIRENIQYGRRHASDREIRDAARSAGAEEFVLETDHGYDTIVGERGVGLSGGQIQRLAIARAFLKDPAVLIMDEATSNLDAHSETLVMAAINRLARGRTTFIIAHRLSVARGADLIVSIGKGRVAETGTHDELLAAGGVYASLWERQVGLQAE